MLTIEIVGIFFQVNMLAAMLTIEILPAGVLNIELTAVFSSHYN